MVHTSSKVDFMGPHDLLLEAERAFWKDNLTEALHLDTLAVSAFQDQKNNEGLATALHIRSTTNRELFHLYNLLSAAKEAHSDASTSLALVQRNNLSFLYGLSCFHLAESEMLMRNYDEAIIYFEQALLSFHHSGILAQKGHYCFRMGESHYHLERSLSKGHARELMLMGLAQLHQDSFVYPFPYVFSLLVDDHMIFAQFLSQEGRHDESHSHIEEAKRILVEHEELLLSKRKFETLRVLLQA